MVINIIGRGKVGFHLNKALSEKFEVNAVNPHSLEELNSNADFTLISVSDSAIEEIISKLPPMKGTVAHTSGSTGMSVFDNAGLKSFGVFYPLQTFTKEKALNYSEIPFYIEAPDSETEKELVKLANHISNRVKIADSYARKKLHIASVFSCNFVNHLWALAEEYLKVNGIDFNDLTPLLEETVNKIKHLSPKDAQTGPAVRNDSETIKSHLKDLTDYPELEALYLQLTESIINFHKRGQE